MEIDVKKEIEKVNAELDSLNQQLAQIDQQLQNWQAQRQLKVNQIAGANRLLLYFQSLKEDKT